MNVSTSTTWFDESYQASVVQMKSLPWLTLFFAVSLAMKLDNSDVTESIMNDPEVAREITSRLSVDNLRVLPCVCKFWKRMFKNELAGRYGNTTSGGDVLGILQQGQMWNLRSGGLQRCSGTYCAPDLIIALTTIASLPGL